MKTTPTQDTSEIKAAASSAEDAHYGKPTGTSSQQSKKSASQRPAVASYLDYREYLRDLYAHLKNSDSRFSFATWSEEGEFKSRSFIRLVMLGKRNLTQESLPRVIKALKLKKAEAQYFENLVNYNQSVSYQSREFFFNKLTQSKNPDRKADVRDMYTYLSNYQSPRVQLLLTKSDIERTPLNLASMLGLTETQVLGILENLQDLGLAEEEHGQWRSEEKALEVKEELGNLALQSFHRKSLEEALRGLELAPSNRQFNALVLSLTEKDYKTIGKDVNDFLDHLLAKYPSEKNQNEKIYQFNLNLIPVSADLIRKESADSESAPETKAPTEIQKAGKSWRQFY